MSMIKYILISIAFCACSIAFGQQPIASFSMDCNLEEDNALYDDIDTPFFPGCDCGIEMESFRLSDDSDLTLDTAISEIFDGDFAFSFYFKSESNINVQELLSAGDNCSSDSTMRIYFLNDTDEILFDISQSIQRTISVRAEVDPNKCWQHVIVSRSANTYFIYINGVLKTTVTSGNDIQIGSSNPIQIGFGPCVGIISNEYEGLIDELQIYDEHIQAFRAEEIYIINDEITTNDTTIFENDFVNVNSKAICGNSVVWSPIAGIDDPTADSIEIEGIETTTYVATFVNSTGQQCTSTDTFNLTVISPDDVQCDDVVLPNVFTPNGDGLNETFRILNPFIIEELRSFQIFDRWGDIVFQTTSKNEEWDGNFKGQPVTSSMLLYKIVYICDGEENVKTGNVSILR